MTDRRYFTRQHARLQVGRRVQARVTITRPALRALGVWVTAGSRGRVVQIASGPGPYDYLVGVRWDDPRPAIPRYAAYPIDWYTEDEFRSLLEAALAKAGVERAA